MDRLLYVAMSGAKQTMLAQQANSNNLANVNTHGFQADLFRFRSMPVQGEGYPTRVYAMTERPATDFTRGAMEHTGRELDAAVDGEGWLAVQARDGSEAYTRAGNLRIEKNGMLVTGAGHPVLGNGGPIVIPPAEKLEIGRDGTISIRPQGQSGAALVIVDRIKLVDPPASKLQKGNDGLIRLADGGDSPPNARVSLVGGTVETSNVNAVESLVDMLMLSRQYEMQVKMMKAADDAASSANQMMSLG